MPWFNPPPLTQKPLHPSVNMMRQPLYRHAYTMGIVMWVIVTQLLWLMGLTVRFFVKQPRPFFWPSHAWLIEFLVIVVGFLIGHTIMMTMLIKKFHSESIKL